MTENYPRLAKSLLRPLLDLLTLSREACGGDGDKFLILLVVAMRTTGQGPLAGDARAPPDDKAVFPSLGVNIQSIADSIGAPKETVRRKVTELVRAGWIVRSGKELYLTVRAYRDLTPVSERLQAMAVSNHELIEALRRGPDGDYDI